jgi:hypothetical protein
MRRIAIPVNHASKRRLGTTAIKGRRKSFQVFKGVWFSRRSPPVHHRHHVRNVGELIPAQRHVWQRIRTSEWNLVTLTLNSSFRADCKGHCDFKLVYSCFNCAISELIRAERENMSLWYFYGCKTVCILRVTSSFSKQPKVSAFAILIIKILNLVLWTHAPVVQYSIAAASVALAGAIILNVLVLLEHNRSKRLSSIISVHLLAQTVADSWIFRTLKVPDYAPVVVRISWASIFTQLALLALESTSRRAQLRNPADYGLEETTGIFDGGPIWWLNKLFWKGNRSVLRQSDLFPLDSELKSQRLRDRAVLAWDESMIPGFCL